MKEYNENQESLLTYYSALQFFNLIDGYTREELYNKAKEIQYMDYKEKFNKSIIILERNIGIYNTDDYSYYYALQFFNLKDGYTREELYNKAKELQFSGYIGTALSIQFDQIIIILERNIGIYNTDDYSYYSALQFFYIKDGYTKEELYNKAEELQWMGFNEEFDKSLIILERNIGIYNTDDYSYYSALEFLDLEDDYTKEELNNKVEELKDSGNIIRDLAEEFKKSVIILERNLELRKSENKTGKKLIK